MKNLKVGMLLGLFILTASLTACAAKPDSAASGDAMKEEPGTAMQEPGSAMKEEPGGAMKESGSAMEEKPGTAIEEPGTAMQEPATAPK